MTIRYSKAAAKAIKAMDNHTRQRVKSAVEGIPNGDIKPLSGSVFYRLRVGGSRIIFRYGEDNIVWIDKIAPRGDVYKGGF